MKDISITENHPIKKRSILGPLGRLILKLINWDINYATDEEKILANEQNKRSGVPLLMNSTHS